MNTILIFLAVCLAQVQAPESPFISNPRQITFDGLRSGEGYFSADGKQMIFQSEREPLNPFYQMYVRNLETGQLVRISPGKGKTTCGWLAPDGLRAIFSSTHLDPETEQKMQEEWEWRKSGRPHPYAWDYDEHFEIFSYDHSRGNQELKQLTHARGYDAEAAMSPDGQWIVFASNRKAYDRELSDLEKQRLKTDPAWFSDLYLMRADGSDVRALVTDQGYEGGPFFSPEGTHVIYRKFSDNGRSAEIYTIGIDGAGRRQITSLGALSWAPYFHPSGDYIIFASNVASNTASSNFELYITDRLGERAPVRITQDTAFDGLPVFTPDGEHLTWSSSRNQGKRGAQIFVADWNDKEARRALGISESFHTQLTFLPKPQSFGATDLNYKYWIDQLTTEETQGRLTGSPGMQLASALVEGAFTQLGLDTQRDPFEFRLPGAAPDSPLQTDHNVIARLVLGAGANRPVILIGGHLDHLGRGEVPSSRAREDEKGLIHFGADDNASGIAGLLESARVFVKLKDLGAFNNPPYDLMFAAWSGEELGLLGSTQFIQNHPELKIAAYLNMDMIGRLRDTLFLQGAGSSTGWRSLIETLGLKFRDLNLVVSDDPFLPTDASSLYAAKVPVLAAFTGVHDEYHTPRDRPELINVAGGTRVTDLMIAMTQALLTGPALNFVELPPPSSGGGRKVSLGTIPDYSGRIGYGLLLTGVVRGSPAEKAGLRAGDVVVRLGDEDVRVIQDYARAMQKLTAGVETTIEILRPGNPERMLLKIVPVAKE